LSAARILKYSSAWQNVTASLVSPTPDVLAQGLSVEQTADLVADALRQHLSQQQQQHQNDHHHQQGQQEPQVVLVGYSMGARVALSLALRHPDLISRLALISATPGIKVS
jgi:pimeloyl-ACP methyl ester carboxylesterase